MRPNQWIFISIVSAIVIVGGFLKWRDIVKTKRAAIEWHIIDLKCAQSYTGYLHSVYSLQREFAHPNPSDRKDSEMDLVTSQVAGMNANEHARHLYNENSAFASAVNEILVRQKVKSPASFAQYELNYCSSYVRLSLSEQFPTDRK